MAWEFSVYLLPSFLAGALSAAVAARAWKYRHERMARPFIAFMLSLAWWAVAYGIELGFSDAASMVLWDKIAFVGSVAAPVAFFLLGVEYAGFDDRLPDWTPAALAVEPLVTLALAWDYPGSRLVWASFDVAETGSMTLPSIVFGPWYWVNLAYSYLLVGAAVVAIASVYARGSRIYRRQAALLIVGAIIPLSANLLYNLVPGLSPFPAIDLTTFAMAATGSLYGLALFRFKMLDLAPAASSLLLGEVGDGFIVVDPEGEIVEGNEIGRALAAEDREHFGDASIDPTRLGSLDGQVLSIRRDGVERAYELRTEPVTDFREERVATLVVMRDITELEVIRRHEQRLSVMNRVLRHNIRNEMNVIAGYGDLLARRLSGREREYAEIVSAKAAKMTAIGEKTRHVSTDVESTGRRHATDVVPIAERVTQRADERFEDADVSLGGRDAARAMLTAQRDLETALEYLVENAVVHDDTDDPTVAVEVGVDDDAVTIAVADTGPGIPDVEQEIMDAETETPLEHGSGLGLWIVYWLVSHSDGYLRFDENDPRGSVVTVYLPRVDGAGG